MAAGDNTFDPTYMAGMAAAVPTGRESSRLRRAANRLRRQGYRSEAGKMMLDAENMRLNEPSIMTPAFRSAVAQGRETVAAARRSHFDDALDFERDIAPMRQQFFQGLGQAGLPAGQQEMLANRFMPLLDNEVVDRQQRAQKVRKDEVAFEQAQLNLQNTRKATKRQREVEGILPNIVDQINPIISADAASTDKISALSALKLKHPTAITDPRLTALFNTAYTQVAGQREDEKTSARQKFDTALAAARTGSLAVVNEFYAPDDDIGRDLGALARAVNSGAASKAELAKAEDALEQKQSGVEYYLTRLPEADKEVNSSMAAFAKGGDDFEAPTEGGVKGTVLSVDEFRKMQFVRVSRVLRDVIGQERFDKTDFAGINLEKISSKELVKEFAALLRQTRDAISAKRDELSGRRYNTLPTTEGQPATASGRQSLFARKFGVSLPGQ